MTYSTFTPLLTDLYQLTMAYGYWRLNIHEQESAFHLLFRKNPFKGNYALSCGLASVVDFLQNWRFAKDDLDYLATLTNHHQEPLFPQEFLTYLGELRFTGDLDAIPEGTVIFPHEPLLRIQGPLLQCQLLETPLLTLVNFQTLVATKASRVCRAAQGDPVIEFGMRRAQGPDGAVSASRAAYVGGCVATSNTLAGKLFDIPVRGTHAHSWVTAFADEKTAFAAYASVMPHNCVLLVDTYNTIEGVKNAIEVGKKLHGEDAELLFNVPPQAFYPPPKVQSSIVRLLPYRDIPYVATNYQLFSDLVKHAFNQRRKTLRNSLKGFVGDAEWSHLSIKSDLRAEDLSVKDFVMISNILEGK